MAECKEGFRLWWAVWIVMSFLMGASINVLEENRGTLWLLVLYCGGVIFMNHALLETMRKAKGHDWLLFGATLALFFIGMAVTHWLLLLVK